VTRVSILDTIVADKRREVEKLPRVAVSSASLRAALNARGDFRDFTGALRRPKSGSIALIAEIKKASPSAGVICPDFDPVRIAREYEAARASCLSVLTDQKFFQGSLEYLRQVRAAVKLPLLRKDFIVDERQLVEAIEWGADAVLLIVAILDDTQLRQLHTLASEAGLGVLVEVHDEAELDRALALGAGLIGINNRNLKTFEVSLMTSERLARRVRSAASPPGGSALLVAESGIHTRADVERLAKCGVQAMLVGESLMKHKDIRAKVQELLLG